MSTAVIRIHSIKHDIELSARVLEHLDKAASRHYALVRNLFDEGDDTKRRSIADETRGVRLDVELASRQLYELLYAIKVLVVKAGRPSAMSQEDWEELNRLCIYRDYLVTHKETAERRRSGLMWGSEGRDLQVGVPWEPLSEEDAKHLAHIFQRLKAKTTLPLDEEENRDEQLQLVYERLPWLESNDKKTAKSLIKRYGVKSDTPDALAAMVLILTEAFFGEQAPIAV